MRDGMPPALRWLGAFAGMALVIAITVPMAIDAITESFRIEDAQGPPILDEDDDADGDGSPFEAPLGAVEDGQAVALADISGRDGTVRQAQDDVVAIGGVEGDAVYFAFPLVPGDPACIAEVTLEVTLLQATPTMLGVYPALVPGIADSADGDQLPDEPFLSDEPRALAETDGTPGILVWDVTALYTEWEGGEPLVLAVRPPEYGNADLRVQLAAVEAGNDGAGRVVWSGTPDCG